MEDIGRIAHIGIAIIGLYFAYLGATGKFDKTFKSSKNKRSSKPKHQKGNTASKIKKGWSWFVGYSETPTVKPRKIQPRNLYHGTTMENAHEIYNTGLWMTGDSEPRAIYMTEYLEVAQEFSKKKGAIVVVRVDPKIKLTRYTKYRDCDYIYEIPNSIPMQEYYMIPGLNPIGILDAKGNKIK